MSFSFIPLKLLFLIGFCLTGSAYGENNKLLTRSSTGRYHITEKAPYTFRGQDAYQLVQVYFEQNPDLKHRLLDPDWVVIDGGWGYHDQGYGSEETMYHLIALQVKAMAERQEIDDMDDVFDEDYGIGSKSHKDKGTINNVFSIWGHPVRSEVLADKNVSALTVYNMFRKTIKNELKAFSRQQSLAWHLQDNVEKTRQTLAYLYQYHSQNTKRLERELEALNIRLPALIKRATQSNLLS